MFYKDDVIPTLQGSEEMESQRMRHSAARHVASMAVDVNDCMELLAMLGLEAKEGKD
jgi:hypothetical protein